MPRALLAVPDALTGPQCEAAIALADGRLRPGPLYGDSGEVIDPARRNVQSALVTRHEAGWLFARLDALFQLGAAEFGQRVGPLAEPVQLLRYDPGGHFAMWHTDAGRDLGDRRLISLSVELSAPDDYDGGALEIVPDSVGVDRTLPRGGVCLFPSQALHRVTPVTRGTRWALVAWTGGLEPHRAGGSAL